MRVPEYQRNTEQEALPDARQRIAVGPDNFLGATASAALGAASEGLDRASRAAADIFSARLQDANQTRALDAANQFEQARQDRLFGQDGAFNVKGAAVFSQPDSVPLADQVRNDLNRSYTDIAAGLGNDEQRRLFAAHSLPAIEQSYGQTLQHENQQYQLYRKGVSQAAIATHTRQAILNYNNPQILADSVTAIRTAHADLAQMDGMPENWAAAQAAKHTGSALQTAFQAALDHNDELSALHIVKHFASDLDASTLLDLNRSLQDVSDNRNSALISQQVMGKYLPRMQTSNLDRAFNVALGSESGNRQFAADGQVMRSPVGAIGKAQLMPDTAREAAKQAGLPWRPELFMRGRTGNADQDAEAGDYNHALGRAYFNSQLQQFHGDVGLAFAAYNAGPGAVKAALARSAKDGGDWLQQLPAETRQYVTKNRNAYGSGGGAFPRPPLQEVTDAAEQHLQKVYGDSVSPSLRKLVLENVSNAYEQHSKAIRQNEESATAEAMRQLQQNGGNYSALPLEVRAAVPSQKLDDVLTFGRRISRGLQPETDWNLYYRLKTSPQLLKETNLMAFRNQLADTEFRQLTDAQQGEGGHQPATSLRTAADVLNSYMAQAGIEPHPAASDREGAATVGRVWSAYESRVADFESQQGKKANTQDMEKIAAQLFTRVPVKRLLFGVTDKPAVLVDRMRDSVVVPDSDRQQIMDEWRRVRPGMPISEDKVFVAYLRKQGLLN
jgi:soluble lytic murein transglycosylase